MSRELIAELWRADVPGDEIAATLGISRRAVLDRVKRMRHAGWDLERRRGARTFTADARSRGARVQYVRTGRFGLPIGDPAHPLTGAVTCGAYPMEEGEGMAATCEFPLSEDRSTASLSVTDPERSDGSVLVLAEGCTDTTPGRGGSLGTVPDSAVVERSLSSSLTAERAESARIADKPSRPCSKCGGPKPPGRGRQFCDECRDPQYVADSRMPRIRPLQPCEQCGGEKPRVRGARLCEKCKPLRPRPCCSCGERAPKAVSDHYCAECKPIIMEANARRREARKALRRKPCKACGRPKLPGVGMLYCRLCREERFGPPPLPVCATDGCEARVHARRATYCANCSRERIRLSWRRKNAARVERYRIDPVYRRKILAQRTRRRKAVEKKQQRERHVGRIPARPLGVAVARWEHQTGEIRTRTAEALGVSTHQILRWETGEIQSVNFHTADLAMVHMDLLWWEIWEEGGEGYAEAQNAFEGVV